MSGFVFEYENPYALEALEAVDRIKDFVLRTPVESSPWLQGLCEELGSQGSREGVAHSVHLKLESEQRTGSFKVRGAVNKVLSLSEEEVRQGLITSSTGNHALAFMYACKERQLLHAGHDAGMPKQHVMRPKIYLPVNASKYKLSKLRSLGAADLVLHGEDCVASEMEAARVARETGAVYVSPYNDMKVIGGQGTIALELLQQLPRKMMDYVFVPVGGGGLIAGVASVLKAADRTIRVIGCQPAASDVMRRSVASGAIVQLKTGDTLSDATAGGIEEGSLTLQPCRIMLTSGRS